MSPVAELGQNLLVRSEPAGQFTVLTATGRLDAATYLMLRDTIVKAALDDARAVIVDVTELFVPTGVGVGRVHQRPVACPALARRADHVGVRAHRRPERRDPKRHHPLRARFFRQSSWLVTPSC